MIHPIRIGLCLLLSLTASAQSPWLLGFDKPNVNPVLAADSTGRFFCPVQQKTVRWEQADVFNPAAVVRNDTLYLLYRAEDNPLAQLGYRTSRIGLAYSTDGLDFERLPEPVLYPDTDEFSRWDYPGGVEDPRVVELEDGSYLMLYTSWNRDLARLSLATSPDLRHWTKHGPVFEQAHGGKFLDHWSKSGAVLTELKDGRLVAKRIEGRYVMYWGETFVNVAYSDNGLDWIPQLDDSGQLKRSFLPTPGAFDSHLVEPGPPALFTADGILLLYNGKNLNGEGAGKETPPGSYCGGQALFDPKHPDQLLRRLETPFICPSLPHEITGQYQAGTTFIEGLVYYHDQWFLYYGTADSMVGVAVRKPVITD